MNTENTQAIAEYSPTEVALAELRQQYQGVQFDVATTKGDEAARKARQTLVKLRTGLEAKRKELKGPALDYAKRIDTEAKRIEAAIRELEEPIDAQIRAEEARKAAEKAEKERIERERVAGIKGRMDAIRNLPVDSTGDSAEQLAATLADLKEFEVTQADFAEFTEDAAVARGYAIEQLERMHGHAVAREEEAARQAAAAAEFERQRQEQEARAAEERAAREEEARNLAAERAELERMRAELEAQKQAQAAPAQPAGSQQTDRRQIEREMAQADAANLMRVDPNDDRHALDVAQAAPQPATTAYKDCEGHSWLIDPGHPQENDPCPECARDAKFKQSPLAPEKPKFAIGRVFNESDIRAAFIAGWECTSTDLARAASAYVASLEG